MAIVSQTRHSSSVFRDNVSYGPAHYQDAGPNQDEESSLQDEDSTLQDEDAILQDKDSSLQDEDPSLQDKDTSLQDKDASILDEDSSFQYEDASLQDEDSSIQDEESSFQDEAAALLQALQVKAAAFSNTDWLAHWTHVGPPLLARGWVTLCPHVPLTAVERATGVGFLVRGEGSEEEREEGGEEEEMAGIVRHTETLHITSEPETTSQDMSCDQSHDQLTDDEIQRMWRELYNSYYWHCYQEYITSQGSPEPVRVSHDCHVVYIPL